MPNILIIDHYDSFSYNLFHLFKDAGATVTIKKCDDIFPSDTTPEKYDGIILSPGPGHVETPKDVGNSKSILRKWQGKIPFLGVCLGHQLIAYNSGGMIETIEPAHGKQDTLILKKSSQLLKDIPNQNQIMRYHSQIVSLNHFPPLLNITATTQEGLIMAFENTGEKLYGVQFHPESVGTPLGNQIAENFVNICKNA